jgi:hypothetical protein
MDEQNNAILQQSRFMHRLLFFMRVALICNGCFLATVSMNLLFGSIQIGWGTGLLIVLGTIGAYAANGLLHFVLLFFYLGRREEFRKLPKWLLWINGSIAVIQLLVLSFLRIGI